MSRLQTTEHRRVRNVLRILGPVILLVGIGFMIVGVADFFAAFGSFGMPHLFWCCFVGIPLMFVGGALSMFGYMGAVGRYAAAEQVPVAADSINDLADETQDAARKMARAAAEGWHEGRGPRP